VGNARQAVSTASADEDTMAIRGQRLRKTRANTGTGAGDDDAERASAANRFAFRRPATLKFGYSDLVGALADGCLRHGSQPGQRRTTHEVKLDQEANNGQY
jgi:hypothetical protein